MAEGARLESVYTARYPGFESLSLRHTSSKAAYNGGFALSESFYADGAPQREPAWARIICSAETGKLKQRNLRDSNVRSRA